MASENLSQLVFPGVVECPTSNPVREIVEGDSGKLSYCWSQESFDERNATLQILSKASSELSPKQFAKMNATVNAAFTQAKSVLRQSKWNKVSVCIPWEFSHKKLNYSGQSCVYTNNLAKDPRFIADYELAMKLQEKAAETAVSEAAKTNTRICVTWQLPYASAWFQSGKICYLPEDPTNSSKSEFEREIEKIFQDSATRQVVR